MWLLHIVDVEFGRLLIGLIFDLGSRGLVRFFWAIKSRKVEGFSREVWGGGSGFPQSGHTRVWGVKRENERGGCDEEEEEGRGGVCVAIWKRKVCVD